MKNLLLSLGALALLAALFVWLRPASDATPAPAPPGAPVVVIPSAKTFDLVIRDKNLVTGEPVLKVTQGDNVVLRITSDRTDELHLHGYDLSLPLRAHQPAELKFKATLSGRFDFELHHAHVDLGALEVTPR